MKKIIILLILLFTILFLPIPYYVSEDAICMEKPCAVGVQCNRGCPTKGWHFGNPLILEIYSYFFQSARNPASVERI